MGVRQSGLWAQAPVLDAAPVIRAQLHGDLRAFLLSSLPASRADLGAVGFEQHVDHPGRPDHQYLEGYFHASAGDFGKCVDSVHPRLGEDLSRRPAPAPIFAFYEAFRRANGELLARIREELSRQRLMQQLASVLERGHHFADLSVQLHWGEAIPASDVAWHMDAANSFLHLAIGLQGRRALHARRRFKDGRISKQCLVGLTDEREVFWQEEGDAYLSCPSCYPHAVEYPETTWDSRIVALQCRLLLGPSEIFGHQIDADPSGGTAAIIFRRLAEAGAVNIPTLHDVQRVVQELEAS